MKRATVDVELIVSAVLAHVFLRIASIIKVLPILQ